MELEGKVALVTGAAKRVGRAIAEALAQEGAHIAVHYRNSRKEAGEAVRAVESLGVRAEAFRADLCDLKSAAALAGAVRKEFGALHVLVNSASLYEKTPFGTVSEKDWNGHMGANLAAPFFLSQAAAPLMKKSGGGKIVNIADWSGLRPYADYIPYCVSKAGLLCLNQALAKALAPDVQVNAVMPGPILPPKGFSASQRRAAAQASLLKRWGSPEDVAQAVLYFIKSGDFVTGAALPVDGGRLIA